MEHCCAATLFGFHDYLQFNRSSFKLQASVSQGNPITISNSNNNNKILSNPQGHYNEIEVIGERRAASGEQTVKRRKPFAPMHRPITETFKLDEFVQFTNLSA